MTFDQDQVYRNSRGEEYRFCACGLAVWDGKEKCPRGHDKGYRVPKKVRKKRHSGYSPYQKDKGGFESSGHS